MPKVTYSEISRLSGVSLATISRVLNNSSNVNAETKQKVLTTMKNLGVDTSSLEKKPSGYADLIIFNFPSLDNPFYYQIIEGASASAHRAGFDLLTNVNPLNDERSVESLLSLLKKTKAAGLIVANCLSESLASRLDDALPMVQCCECVPSLGIPFVTVDDISAARGAVQYLLSLGRRRVSLINGPHDYKYAKDRLKGYIQALESANISIDPDIIVELREINYDMALSASFQLMNSPKRPDAFFTVSDVYAAAVIKAGYSSGLRIPQDISVVGFDNIQISEICNPSITTVNQPKYQLGLMSCDMLIKQIYNEEIPMKQMYLGTELIIRNTTS